MCDCRWAVHISLSFFSVHRFIIQKKCFNLENKHSICENILSSEIKALINPKHHYYFSQQNNGRLSLSNLFSSICQNKGEMNPMLEGKNWWHLNPRSFSGLVCTLIYHSPIPLTDGGAWHSVRSPSSFQHHKEFIFWHLLAHMKATGLFNSLSQQCIRCHGDGRVREMED